MSKEMVSAKMSPVTKDRLDEYADEAGISRSEAVDRMVKQGLDVEESDMRLVPVKSDGGTVIEDRLDEIEEDIESVGTDIKSVESASDSQTRMSILIVVSLIWIGAELSINFPSWFTLASGVGLMALLFGTLYRREV